MYDVRTNRDYCVTKTYKSRLLYKLIRINRASSKRNAVINFQSIRPTIPTNNTTLKNHVLNNIRLKIYNYKTINQKINAHKGHIFT